MSPATAIESVNDGVQPLAIERQQYKEGEGMAVDAGWNCEV